MIIIMKTFYVKCVLLNLEIYTNFCKSIYNDGDKIMGTWATNVMKALYNNRHETIPGWNEFILSWYKFIPDFMRQKVIFKPFEQQLS